MIIEVILITLFANFLFQIAQVYSRRLWNMIGLHPFLFFIASLIVGFTIGLMEGLICFVTYFFGGMVTGGLLAEWRLTKHDKKNELDRQMWHNYFKDHEIELDDSED